MTKTTVPPTPVNEAARMKAVLACDILDTAPELAFDALARLTSFAFKVPIASVAVMGEDRLWFKAKVGVPFAQLDRRIAPCAYAIMSPNEALVVNDLRADPRFESNPLVIGDPYARFYAGAPIVDAEGNALGTVSIFDLQPREFSDTERQALLDIAQLVMAALQSRRHAHRLSQIAKTDYLTGIANRAQFEMAVAAEIQRASRTHVPFVVLCMDLDGFKAINDRFGHAAGDEVLLEVSKRLTSVVRGNELLARIGGDEFAIVMREGSIDAAETLVERIVGEVEQPIRLTSGNEVSVGISVGFASYAPQMTGAEIISRADDALYIVKRHSRSQRSAHAMAQ